MLDLTKPMQTRHGYPARLISDQHKHEYGPLVFAIRHPEGVEKLGFRDAEGRYPRSLAALADFPSDWDIINAPIPDNMVIVTIKRGMAAVTQVPDGVVVKVMDYDVEGIDEDALIRDEHDKPCRVELFGPAGPYHVWPFA